jgi:TatA/E family protein of Tat protein translocase
MFNIGPLELMVILIIALLVVGPKRLPEVGRSIGRGIREFRKAQDEVQRTIQSALDEEPPSTPPEEGSTAPQDAAEEDDEQAPSDLARHVGKGLAELRRAREEIRQSFRVDLDDEDRAE